MWIWKSFTDSMRQIGRSPMLLYFVRLLLMEWHFSLCIRCLFGYVADSLNRRTAKSSQSLVLFNVLLTTSPRQLQHRIQLTPPLFIINSDCAKYTKVALIEIIYIEMLFKYRNKYRSWVKINTKSCWKMTWVKTIPESTLAKICLKVMHRFNFNSRKTNKRTVQGHSDTA